jgi:hypothetical protein
MGWALATLLALAAAAGCGDDEDVNDEGTGGRTGTGGAPATPTGGRNTGDAGSPGEAGAASPSGGRGGAPAGEGGSAGSADCNIIEDFVPSSADDAPGPACEAYAECMSDGCGDLYEPAFGADWESGDLSGGACGPSVPCFEGCGCDEACLTGCLGAAVACAQYALLFQGCYAACEETYAECAAERAP